MTLVRQPMHGKICMVTGATSGLGLATTQALSEQGATVIAVGRSAARVEAAAAQIRTGTGSHLVEWMLADLSSQKEIRALAHQFQSRYQRLHVLVNNVGASYGRRRESVDGIEMTFALNHLAPFLLTNLLLVTLKATAPSRVLNVSSEVHRSETIDLEDLESGGRFDGYRAYRRSKLLNILFTYELAGRLEGTGVTVNALSPGLVATNLGLGDGGMQSLMKRLINVMAVSPQKGAQTAIYLATSPDVEAISGKYFVKQRPVPSSNVTYDNAIAGRLWEISAQLTGLPTKGRS